jgi:mono/diheme cytochrome c family protein
MIWHWMAGFYKFLSFYDKICSGALTRFNWIQFMNSGLNHEMLGKKRPAWRLWFAPFLVTAALIGESTLGTGLPAAEQFRKDVQPILNKYCSDCHADGAKKGGVSFDEFKSDAALLQPDLWLHALKNTRAGLMPPKKKPQPTKEDRLTLERWIKYAVFGIDPKDPDPGRVTVRRLNRVEYRNTVHDLLGIDFNADAEFPPDDTGYGFDNIGDVLTISPMLLEKYLAAAQAIVAETVPVVSGVLPEKVIAGNQFRSLAAANATSGQGGRRAAPLYLPFDEPAAISNTFRAEQTGTYKLTVDLAVSRTPNSDPSRCRLYFKADDRELLNREFDSQDNNSIRSEFDQHWEQGEHALVFDLSPLAMNDKSGSNALQIRVNSVTVRGPMEKQYWPRPMNYDRFFPRAIPQAADERRQYARELLDHFATRAFRRAVDTKTVNRLVKLAEGVYSQPDKTFEAGVAHAMVAVLTSPRFLFRLEDTVTESSSADWAWVDEYSLASRLSYFLWSSMPDEELFDLAGQGKLRQNLAAQVTRMLEDSRSEALVANFTGQWLQARDVAGLNINARAVFARDAIPSAAFDAPTNGPANRLASTNLTSAPPVNPQRLNFGNFNRRRGPQPPFQLDGAMKRSMQKEIETFFSHVIHEDRPVLELIRSDYIFANSDLAKIYGLTNMDLRGTELRRVSLPPDSPRGGVLTAGAVLAVTSTPERTSPVKRGLFVLNNFFGLPVPPPPPNIPALEVAEKDFKDRQPTLREALEIHRENALCSSCHSRMDPIGLGLENFNALGVWREKEYGQTIETAGQLVTGETFNSVQEFKRILATTHKTDFYACLTEKLLTYALGRGVEYYDTETVDQIVKRIEQENGHFSALLHGIIESAPFQKRRTRANATLAESVESTAPATTVTGAKRKTSL